ncbi:MAG: leucyl/phenylalanyl-tRNA--protein transferase [Pseudohongiellaceae bacterium]
MPVSWLESTQPGFPPVNEALEEPNGLLAAGGELTVPWLVSAYRAGIFPWFEEGQPILWWSPDPRMVLKPESLKISRSMTKFLRRCPFEVTMDTAFPEVINACAQPRDENGGTWITEEMQDAYIALFNEGVAHSVEVWLDGALVGGLYGVAMGQVFFGESMFSRESNASKTGFVRLVQQLRKWHFKLVDCQVTSEHLSSLGATEISRDQFNQYLNDYVNNPTQQPLWLFDETEL